jgi:hypothetical protein
VEYVVPFVEYSKLTVPPPSAVTVAVRVTMVPTITDGAGLATTPTELPVEPGITE